MMALKVKKLVWFEAHEGMWLRAEPEMPGKPPIYEIPVFGEDNAKAVERKKAMHQKQFDKWVLDMKTYIDSLIVADVTG